MRTKSGRAIFGVSFADIASGERSRCNVMPCSSPTIGEPGRIVLHASGAQYGSPLEADSLDEQSRQEYDSWSNSSHGLDTPVPD